ncbi:hypothetical protein DXG01_005469 [Tephrocybe rancida]|nr:hypothetical protein DXG01_005469 [Tephrocybe rancida]
MEPPNPHHHYHDLRRHIELRSPNRLTETYQHPLVQWIPLRRKAKAGDEVQVEEIQIQIPPKMRKRWLWENVEMTVAGVAPPPEKPENDPGREGPPFSPRADESSNEHDLEHDNVDVADNLQLHIQLPILVLIDTTHREDRSSSTPRTLRESGIGEAGKGGPGGDAAQDAEVVNSGSGGDIEDVGADADTTAASSLRAETKLLEMTTNPPPPDATPLPPKSMEPHLCQHQPHEHKEEHPTDVCDTHPARSSPLEEPVFEEAEDIRLKPKTPAGGSTNVIADAHDYLLDTKKPHRLCTHAIVEPRKLPSSICNEPIRGRQPPPSLLPRTSGDANATANPHPLQPPPLSTFKHLPSAVFPRGVLCAAVARPPLPTG